MFVFLPRLGGLGADRAGFLFGGWGGYPPIGNYLSPRAVSGYGPRTVVVLGLLTCALGCGDLLAVDTGTPSWVTALLMIPLGLGGSLAMPALTSLMLDSIAAERAGTAAALLNTSRQTGGALSIAVFGALLADDFASGMGECLLLAACLLVATALGAAALLPRR
ncbi:MFS transporter [Streptomyces platensis]|uniref:MFS transporter n=1 Tax=Streptomyces platensis TaxID=58346 RepID=UPI003684474D